MKKVLAIVLAAMMVCLMMPAMAEMTTEVVTGTWYLVEMSSGGQTFSPSLMGMEMVMILNEDGTAIMSQSMGETSEDVEGSWAIEEDGLTVTANDSPAVFQMVDDTLVAEDSGMTMVFSREAGEVATMPAAVAAESEDAFLGDWVFSKAEIMGMVMDANMLTAMLGAFSSEEADTSALDLSVLNMTIESGKIVMAGQEVPTAFEDGMLKLQIELPEGEDVSAALENVEGGEEAADLLGSMSGILGDLSGMEFSFVLCEDGSISLPISITEDYAFTFNFAHPAE